MLATCAACVTPPVQLQQEQATWAPQRYISLVEQALQHPLSTPWVGGGGGRGRGGRVVPLARTHSHHTHHLLCTSPPPPSPPYTNPQNPLQCTPPCCSIHQVQATRKSLGPDVRSHIIIGAAASLRQSIESQSSIQSVHIAAVHIACPAQRLHLRTRVPASLLLQAPAVIA